MSDNDEIPAAGNKEEAPATEHLNIKVTDSNNEVFFKIKKTTQLIKLMNAFCDKQGKNLASCRFLFDGQRVTPQDTPENVSARALPCDGSTCASSGATLPCLWNCMLTDVSLQLEMVDGDTLEVHQEQIGGGR
jgi:small ubiquitin-related modifier